MRGTGSRIAVFSPFVPKPTMEILLSTKHRRSPFGAPRGTKKAGEAHHCWFRLVGNTAVIATTSDQIMSGDLSRRVRIAGSREPNALLADEEVAALAAGQLAERVVRWSREGRLCC